MNGKRLFQVLVALVLTSAVVLPAGARTSDAPTFGVWLAQWAQYGRHNANERLPCLRADKAQCDRVFSSRSAHQTTARKHTAKSKRHKLAIKKLKRVKSRGHAASASVQNLGAFSWTSGGLLLADGGVGRMLTIDPGTGPGGAPLDVPALDGFLGDLAPPPGSDAPAVTDAAAGVGDNAYGALYDFEDDGAVGENPRGFQEISSLLAPQTVLAAASQVPEPGTVLLVGGALLAMRLARQRRSPRGALLPGAF